MRFWNTQNLIPVSGSATLVKTNMEPDKGALQRLLSSFSLFRFHLSFPESIVVGNGCV